MSRDAITIKKLENFAESISKAAERGDAPSMNIPSRTLNNTRFNRLSKIIETGPATHERSLFHVGQAKAYMQTALIASGIKRLISSGKTISLRSLYYTLKHTIPGTREETFAGQEECDPIIEDLEVVLSVIREECHLFAEARGAMCGPITVRDKGDVIDCRKMGSGGYGIPGIVEPDIIQFLDCDAKFILHVEKGTVWGRFNEDKFWKKHNCILTHGGGQASRGARRLLHRMHHELNLPVYCLLDNDPWGYYIYSVIKQGSINLAHESKRMAIPQAKFLGVRSRDYQKYKMKPHARITLSEKDVKRAHDVMNYPWFINKQDWRDEIDLMLANNFKLEVESLASLSISFVTEQYIPRCLEEKEWLD